MFNLVEVAIQLVPIKTLQHLHEKLRVVNERFETNLACYKGLKYCVPFVPLKSII